MERPTVCINTSDARAIAAHLNECSHRFMPPLVSRIDIGEYSNKLARLADRFEIWSGPGLVGLLAVYLNRPDQGVGFISSFSVHPCCSGRGFGRALMEECVRTAAVRGFRKLSLEVNAADDGALSVYRKLAFLEIGRQKSGFVIMSRNL